jgi:hypothetical protein
MACSGCGHARAGGDDCSFCVGLTGGSVVARQGHGAASRRGSRAGSRCGNSVRPGCSGAGCGSVGLGGGCVGSGGR